MGGKRKVQLSPSKHEEQREQNGEDMETSAKFTECKQEYGRLNRQQLAF